MKKTQSTFGKPKKKDPLARDKYLQKKFGISQKEYNEALSRNGGVCSISGQPQLGDKSLHLDHDHKIERWKIVSKNVQGLWWSWPSDEGPLAPVRLRFKECDPLKQVSRAKVKARLKRLSARGILSWRANTGLRKWNDDPVLMRNAATYIDNYQKFLSGESSDRNGFGE